MMKIGEFAKICETKISVLRHYDREGLLRPVYIDRFTGYRYYDDAQIPLFFRITRLKQAGFSLAEIKALMSCHGDAAKVAQIFEMKKSSLHETLRNLETIQNMMLGEDCMKSGYTPIRENIELPFVNDEAAIGRWEFVGVAPFNGTEKREIYFLPNGEKYWCFGWTKGKLFYDDGVNTIANDYTLENREDGLYMHIDMKSVGDGGAIKKRLLHKLDGKHYTREGIARKDDLNYPFVNDARVIGKWKAAAFLLHKEEFLPLTEESVAQTFFFNELEFFENGHVNAVYGDEFISGDDKQVWTKGYVLRKFNHTACAYELREHEGIEYLIIEWKSGDYRWGGFETDYYVFIRA